MRYEFLSYPEEIARSLYEEGKEKALAILKRYEVDDVDGVMMRDGSNATCGLLVRFREKSFFYPFFDEGEGVSLPRDISMVIDGEVIGEGEPPVPPVVAEEAFNCFSVVKVVEEIVL